MPFYMRSEYALDTGGFYANLDKVEGNGLWNFKRKVDDIQINRKNKHMVHKLLVGHPETIGQRRKFNKEIMRSVCHI